LVLSDHIQFNMPSGHTVLAMITSQKNPDWPLDTTITDNRQAGLKAPSRVRMKLFTLDNRLIVKKIGTLISKDKKAVIKALRSLLGTKLDLQRQVPSAMLLAVHFILDLYTKSSINDIRPNGMRWVSIRVSNLQQGAGFCRLGRGTKPNKRPPDLNPTDNRTHNPA
jgi:mRNA interferase MazF